MKRHFFSSAISEFLEANEEQVLGSLAAESTFSLEITQRDAWIAEIRILKTSLTDFRGAGAVYFEYSIPRLGKRIDVVLLIGPVIFVLEFKVGESHFTTSARDQVTDYCLDLKNFNETSADCLIAQS